jgi:formylglycine-generating enzyme required for sulfatase activity
LDFGNRLDEALRLPMEQRVAPLAALGHDVLQANGAADHGLRDRLVSTLAQVVGEGVGTPLDRLAAGEVLGWLGDPRLHGPREADYWAKVDGVQLGRFPVTNAEFQAWVREGGYEDRAAWSENGWAWLRGCPDPWKAISAGEENKRFLVPNQPVVGVTWWEAEAHARSVGARLPTSDERLLAVRGPQKRPYPWGEPFGSGNANTREEVLNRPCAVGLFVRDRTPEGIYDLAGNVGEWLADEVGATGSGTRKMQMLRFVHPGAWNQPSMASWAKAKDLRAPDDRSGGIGFRLARD